MTSRSLNEQAGTFIDLMPKLMRKLSSLDVDDPAMELPVAQLRLCSILREGPQSMSAISRELGITHSAMTQIADRLERQGMVERLCESGDRRVKCLQLTAHGQEVMRRRREKRLQRALEIMETLTPDARESVISALQSLLTAADLSSNQPDAPTGAKLEFI